MLQANYAACARCLAGDCALEPLRGGEEVRKLELSCGAGNDGVGGGKREQISERIVVGDREREEEKASPESC
jgi:hypothetical protein